MNKGWISILSGIMIGLLISLLTLEYNGWEIIHYNAAGNAGRTINELDFDLITNAFIIIAVSISMIYVGLTVFEKYSRRHDS